MLEALLIRKKEKKNVNLNSNITPKTFQEGLKITFTALAKKTVASCRYDL